jgi:RsiW-degrading membrane proteinase PrsW (M82 family)
MSFDIPSSVVFFSLIGGVVPALIWLLFWLREDRKRPEPRGLVMATFLAGMIAVPLVIPLQQWVNDPTHQSFTFFLWAGIEELFKFGAAWIVALRQKETNEPIDAIIYMMTAALGFAALENTIFLFHPLQAGNISETLITGDVRFIGASLLHTISSAAIGISIGLSFYKDKMTEIAYVIGGIITAIVLHTAFNLFIIKESNGITFAVFGFVWIAIVILMLFFEKIKRIYPVNKI